MFKPVLKSSLYKDVVNQLLEEIKKETWGPGEKFPGELELANEFEVSRNSIREALKSLQLMGVIESFPGRGTFVTKEAVRKIQNSELVSLLSDNEGSYMELLEVRMAIEAQASYLAAQRVDDEGIVKLENALRELEERMKKREDYAMQGFHFHMCIAELSQNQYILKFFQTISEELIAQRNLQYQEKIDTDKSLKDHIDIFEAIKNRDADKAREAMHKHFIHAMGDVKDQ
ncbi:FadR family transcriptional regulator [Halobacillus yeomjeoni]|uniref:FadR/GntR family transcriptional regulator n=1 Tax=Halobacillus yeomjeoni TaxID=311194 RepID=UPI001CD26EAA|nr:FadR/GntR family transcriptional regulator [Halobacillus yeomjeoni]MCA0984445.1 FadR family transcriptional regulator [Halobacillus yeomjeoni]